MKRNVLILFGGKSCEHDISIISAFQCLKYFDKSSYDLTLIYIDKEGRWRLLEKTDNIDTLLKNKTKLKEVQLGINDNLLYIKKRNSYKRFKEIDIVFPILHGVNGEDGAIMGLLNMSNIPYVGCSQLSSGIGIDKSVFKRVCSDLPILDSVDISEDDVNNNEEKLTSLIEKKIGFPCIIKPSRLGSSIGINVCKKREDVVNLLKNSLKFDKKLIVEKFVNNMREFNVALYKINNEIIVSDIEEPIFNEDVLSFKDKYLNFSDQQVSKNIPAQINKSLKNQIIKYAKMVYDRLDCSGVVRIDFIFDKDCKNLWINEINTIPGALALYLFESIGIDRGKVITDLINDAIKKYHNMSVLTNFDSNVLTSHNFSKYQ